MEIRFCYTHPFSQLMRGSNKIIYNTHVITSIFFFKQSLCASSSVMVFSLYTILLFVKLIFAIRVSSLTSIPSSSSISLSGFSSGVSPSCTFALLFNLTEISLIFHDCINIFVYDERYNNQ